MERRRRGGGRSITFCPSRTTRVESPGRQRSGWLTALLAVHLQGDNVSMLRNFRSSRTDLRENQQNFGVVVILFVSSYLWVGVCLVCVLVKYRREYFWWNTLFSIVTFGTSSGPSQIKLTRREGKKGSYIFRGVVISFRNFWWKGGGGKKERVFEWGYSYVREILLLLLLMEREFKLISMLVRSAQQTMTWYVAPKVILEKVKEVSAQFSY